MIVFSDKSSNVGTIVLSITQNIRTQNIGLWDQNGFVLLEDELQQLTLSERQMTSKWKQMHITSIYLTI